MSNVQTEALKPCSVNTTELKKLAEAATPGPWIAAGPSLGSEFPVYCEEVVVDREHDDDDGYGICQAPTGLEKESTHDMSYIAAANPAAILELLERLAAVEQELEAEREETKRWINAAKWEKEIRKEAEKIADKAVIELEALKRAISEAEPVAHIYVGGIYGNELQDWEIEPEHGLCEKLNEDAYRRSEELTLPLYALKGIK